VAQASSLHSRPSGAQAGSLRYTGILVVFLLAVSVHAADTAEALKVAAWLRTAPAASADATFFGALGAVSMTSIVPQTDFVRTNGPAALYDDPTRLAAAQTAIASRSQFLGSLTGGGIRWFRDVQNAPWGMIEVTRGRYQYELLDTIVQTATAAGAHYVGTVMPYAGWELRAAGYAPSADAQCQRLFTEDFFYLAADQRMDVYKDEAEYLEYLSRLLQRYPQIEYWQIHNEPEGDHCGLFRNDVGAFVTLMRDSYQRIHALCPNCKVLNGGAAAPLFRENQVPPLGGVNFWRDFAAAGGAAYIDVIAVHYNEGKDPDHGNVADFEYQIRHARELLGPTKPVWVTEFGVVIGNAGNFTGLTETAAAAWYLRMVPAALAAGASRFFPDATGFVETNGTTYLTFYVAKLLQLKLGNFTAATRVSTGQYRFTVNNNDVWLVWTGMPLSGTVRATDMYGNITVADAATLTPSETAPMFLEPTSRHRAAKH